MSNESFIQLFIEFGPAEFQGATLWVSRAEDTSIQNEGEVIVEQFLF